ncbi:MAG: hypothetical protein Q7R31_03050 [Candidatus Levybacteria bacterium]|nr:hypothetical protein [Candidatus Levybacteria bacterium]
METARRRIQLVVSINGTKRTELTGKGLMVQELVRIDYSLRKHERPSVSFKMSDDMVRAYSERRDELYKLLGLPENQITRAKIIDGYSGKLWEIGHPHWHFK